MDSEKKIKVGLPRALHYYKYHVFWEDFLKQLDFEVVTSPENNQLLMKNGLSLAVDESCLSVKIFLGHVDYLKDKVDFIFIPRLVSVHENEEICTKFMALGDIVRSTFEDIKISEYTVDVGNYDSRKHFEILELKKLSSQLDRSPVKVISAFKKAKEKQEEYNKKRQKKQQEKLELLNKENPTILVVSHPYTTYDSLLGKPIIKFLESENVNLFFSDSVDLGEARKLSDKLSPDLYWTYNKELLGSIEMYKDKVDGIIFLMVFPCGPDSLVVNFCQNKIKDIPMSVITLDELSGEAGLKTRLESFVDILRLRKKKDDEK